MMTNMNNVALTDAAATPVTHQFTPAPRDGAFCRWLDREHNAGVPAGFASLTYDVKEPTSNDGSGVYRQKVTLSIPKVDFTVPSAPKVLGVSRVVVEFVFHSLTTDQERKDAISMMKTVFTIGTTTALGDNVAVMQKPY